MKRVLLSSFHTGSVFALLDQDLAFPTIVSFDSHIDTNLMGYRQEIVENISRDQKMQESAGRSAVHGMMHFQLDDFLEGFFLVTSKVCLEIDAVTLQMIANRLSEEKVNLFENARNTEDVLEQLKDFTKMAFGIDVVTCPPKDPVSTIKKLLEDHDEMVFDIDVDYFGDCQTECYTPMKEANKFDLGNLNRVIRLIHSVKPELITLSEFTIDAFNDPNSKTNYLLAKLKNLGYSIEKFSLVKNDVEAKHYLKLWEDFETFYRNNTTMSFDIQDPMAKERIDELKILAKTFFDKNLK